MFNNIKLGRNVIKFIDLLTPRTGPRILLSKLIFYLNMHDLHILQYVGKTEHFFLAFVTRVR